MTHKESNSFIERRLRMSYRAKQEYFKQIYNRYRKALRREKSLILDEFCIVCGYNRKYAITKLNGPSPFLKKHPKKSGRDRKSVV